MAKLTDEELEVFLTNTEGWASQGDAIVKDFPFPGFRAAIAFVNRVADRAEEARHHPDIEIRYNHVRISLSTHDAGGVTEKDVAGAAGIDEAADSEAGAAGPDGG
ncbi:MAG: 4a-hydroxytetrahydrobiopterin dehydratase [Actinomycetota bacterium]|nr:4a-hydroxytetrahydrobiopterin dehydratase [Actinomycetota bacterium]